MSTVAEKIKQYRKPGYFDEFEYHWAMTIDLDPANSKATVTVGEEVVELVQGELSEWVSLIFPAVPMVKVRGICRMLRYNRA